MVPNQGSEAKHGTQCCFKYIPKVAQNGEILRLYTLKYSHKRTVYRGRQRVKNYRSVRYTDVGSM
jgi:hypothetical protein